MPRDDAWTYGDAVCDLLGAAQNPEERAKARWQCCAEVLRNLGHYRPQHAPIEPPEVRPLRLLDFEEVRKACEAKPNVARAFGYWRAEVTAWEADNAGKLYCLAWCLLTLIELRAFFEPETVDQAIGHVGDWIEQRLG